MIPYVEWRTIPLGPVTLQVWGMFAAIGILTGSWWARREAGKRGLDLAKIERLAFWTILWGFIGARLFHFLAYEPAALFVDPSAPFRLWEGGYSSFGGFFAAAGAFFLLAKRYGLDVLRAADAFAVALPLGMGCGRIGCFLIHDHPGTLAHGFWKRFAVDFPGGPRYDLGLLLGVLDFLIFGLFLVLSRHLRPPSFFLQWLLLLYAPARFLLDFLRAADARWLGLTPAQFGCIALFAAGVLLARKRPKASGN